MKLRAALALGLCLATPDDAQTLAGPLILSCQLSEGSPAHKVEVSPRPYAMVVWSGKDGAPDSIFAAGSDGTAIIFYGNSLFKNPATGSLATEKVSGSIDLKTGQFFWGRLVGQCKGVT